MNYFIFLGLEVFKKFVNTLSLFYNFHQSCVGKGSNYILKIANYSSRRFYDSFSARFSLLINLFKIYNWRILSVLERLKIVLLYNSLQEINSEAILMTVVGRNLVKCYSWSYNSICLTRRMSSRTLVLWHWRIINICCLAWSVD